jgi:hypothetical protein
LSTIARSGSQRGSLGPRPPVKPVQRDNIDRFMDDVAGSITAGRQKTRSRGLSIVRGGHGVATRTVGLLGAIFTYAMRKGLRIDNPAHGVVKFAEHRRERRLTDHEYRQLGNSLLMADPEGIWKAMQLMALSVWRRGAVLGLTMVGNRSSTAAGKTGRHQDRSITSAAVANGLHGDHSPALDQRSGVPC